LLQWIITGLVSVVKDSFEIEPYHYDWLFSNLRLADVDALLNFRGDGDRWLQGIWRKARPGLIQTVLKVAKRKPETYKHSLGPTLRMIVDLHR
jgi:hypothetical protein